MDAKLRTALDDLEREVERFAKRAVGRRQRLAVLGVAVPAPDLPAAFVPNERAHKTSLLRRVTTFCWVEFPRLCRTHLF
ncbi:MAG: hypothetical protein WDM91_04085 [Rhizomicrobium sp.]